MHQDTKHPINNILIYNHVIIILYYNNIYSQSCSIYKFSFQYIYDRDWCFLYFVILWIKVYRVIDQNNGNSKLTFLI